jgi:kinetochore protein Spc24
MHTFTDDAISVLTRALESARTSSTRPPTVPSEEAHAKALHDLDVLRLSLAKSINDAEGQLAMREAELSSLKKQRTELEARDPASEHQLSSTPCV